MKTIKLRAPFGEVRIVPTGFCWPQLFLSFLVPLWRADWRYFATELALLIFSAAFTVGIGMPIVALVFAFIYNKLYIKDLLARGYQPLDIASKQYLIQHGITGIDIEM